MKSFPAEAILDSVYRPRLPVLCSSFIFQVFVFSFVLPQGILYLFFVPIPLLSLSGYSFPARCSTFFYLSDLLQIRHSLLFLFSSRSSSFSSYAIVCQESEILRQTIYCRPAPWRKAQAVGDFCLQWGRPGWSGDGYPDVGSTLGGHSIVHARRLIMTPSAALMAKVMNGCSRQNGSNGKHRSYPKTNHLYFFFKSLLFTCHPSN